MAYSVRVPEEIYRLVQEYAARKDLRIGEASVKLLSWGARLSAAHKTRKNQT